MEEYEEIDLRRLIITLGKNRTLFVSVFLAILVGSLIYAKYAPVHYFTVSSLEIGYSEDKLIESPIQLAAKIGKGIYGSYSGLSAVPVPSTNIIDISVTSNSKNSLEKDNEFIKSLDAKVIESHEKIIDLKNQKIEKNIEILQKETDYLMSKGQQIATIRSEIITLQARLDEGSSPTKIIAEPIVRENHPNFFLILISGGVLGLFLGVVLISIKEWIKNKKT